MESTNLSAKKREKMLEFLNDLRESNKDDEKVLKAINEIESELNNKKYGLVWEEHEEEVDRMLKNNIPVFSEVHDKEIKEVEDDGFNFLLEGDNLHSLKLLEKTHKGKVDVIYIDPPYNTGNEDFAYNDVLVGTDDSYRHSKWLSFMQRRLEMAKMLMSVKGLIFISIDDNELYDLKLLCDSVFGENNYVNTIAIKSSEVSGLKMSHVSKRLPKLKEYVLVYKNKEIDLKPLEISKNENVEEFKKYAKYYSKIIWNPEEDVEHWKVTTIKEYIEENKVRVDISDDDELLKFKIDNASRIVYRTNNKSLEKMNFEETIKKVTSKNGKEYIWWEGKQMLFLEDYTKSYLCDLWTDISTINLNKEGGVDFPNGKKPQKLLKRILELSNINEAAVLDFFAGSGSTAEAVLELNKEDGGNRKFILCTNNENNICEDITYQRIKTVITGKRKDGSEYSEGIPANLKYYKTDFVSKDEEYLTDDLNEHIKEMVQLELGVDIDDSNYCLVLSDDDADELEEKIDEMKDLKGIYVSKDVLLTSSQKTKFKDLEKHVIPDCYYDLELKENGE